MDKYEVAQRASALPTRFAERVPPSTLESIQLMEEGGEYEELTIELAASLAAHNTPGHRGGTRRTSRAAGGDGHAHRSHREAERAGLSGIMPS
jgi:hypothetical protein